MNILEIKGIIKKFKDVTALNMVDITVERGELVGLLGPNGAGKSTLLNILSGIITKDKGEVEIFGEKLKGNMKSIKKRMGVVPQELAIYYDHTAYENVKFFAGLYGVRGKDAHDKIMKALEFVGLENKAKAKAETFSGGMKRRLNIACAIAHEPDIIFMDEPTVGIDPQSRNNILKWVKKLNDAGTTIIYTSHYMEEVEAICDKVFIMDHGKVIAQGTKEELSSLITTVKEIQIECGVMIDIDKKSLEQIKGVQSVEFEDRFINITSDKDKDNFEKILEALRLAGVQVRNINVKVPNLETVFLSLTGRKLRDY